MATEPAQTLETDAEGRRGGRGQDGIEGLQARSEDTGEELGQEERESTARGSQLVAELTTEALEQAFADQAAEVVAHLAGGVPVVWDAQQVGDVRSELAAGDARW